MIIPINYATLTLLFSIVPHFKRSSYRFKSIKKRYKRARDNKVYRNYA